MLQNLKTELNNFSHSPHTIALSKSTIFAKKILMKKMLTSAKLRGSTYVCVLTYQISSF